MFCCTSTAKVMTVMKRTDRTDLGSNCVKRKIKLVCFVELINSLADFMFLRSNSNSSFFSFFSAPSQIPFELIVFADVSNFVVLALANQ